MTNEGRLPPGGSCGVDHCPPSLPDDCQLAVCVKPPPTPFQPGLCFFPDRHCRLGKADAMSHSRAPLDQVGRFVRNKGSLLVPMKRQNLWCFYKLWWLRHPITQHRQHLEVPNKVILYRKSSSRPGILSIWLRREGKKAGGREEGRGEEQKRRRTEHNRKEIKEIKQPNTAVSTFSLDNNLAFCWLVDWEGGR